MSLNLLIILGSCIVGALFGLLIYWLIIRIQKTLQSHQYKSMERQTQSKITEDIGDSSLEQPINEENYLTDIQRKTDTKSEDDDWLNNGVPKTTASTIRKEDDDWLNAGVEEVPTKDYKQQDDDWLNAENNQSLETVEEPSLNYATTSRPEIQIKQDGPILNITVTKAPRQDIKPEQTVINLRINVSPQDSTRKGEELYDVEITPSYLSLQDITKVKFVDESINQSHSLLDEISVRSIENPDIEIQASDIQTN